MFRVYHPKWRGGETDARGGERTRPNVNSPETRPLPARPELLLLLIRLQGGFRDRPTQVPDTAPLPPCVEQVLPTPNLFPLLSNGNNSYLKTLL